MSEALVIVIDGRPVSVDEMYELALNSGWEPQEVNRLKRRMRQLGHNVQVVPESEVDNAIKLTKTEKTENEGGDS